MWIHESFANYAENLYVECQTGDKKAGAEYVIGTRKLVRNDRPVEGVPGVNDEGSGNDHYYKGGNLLHTVRQLVGNDAGELGQAQRVEEELADVAARCRR